MRNDTQIQRDVIDELRWDPSVTDNEIGVAVEDGVVTLTGYVPNFAERYAAEVAAGRVEGVRAVAAELEVKLLAGDKRTDTDIAHKALDALSWDVTVPDDNVRLRVTNGWITLEGDVEWQHQKEAAARAVRNLAGVRGVTNLVRVKRKLPARVSRRAMTQPTQSGARWMSAPREAHMLARDLMCHDPFVVEPTDSLTRAAEVMRNVGVGIVPVVDDVTSMHLRGVITDRDIAVRCVAAGHAGGCLVADHMTWPPLHMVRPEDTAATVLDTMETARVRRVMVVDDDQRLLGVIAQADIARKLGPEAPEKVAELVEQVSSPVPVLT